MNGSGRKYTEWICSLCAKENSLLDSATVLYAGGLLFKLFLNCKDMGFKDS